MPEPNCEDEDFDSWMERCMSDEEAIEDFPDQDQRAAFCSDLWERECDEESARDPELWLLGREVEEETL